MEKIIKSIRSPSGLIKALNKDTFEDVKNKIINWTEKEIEKVNEIVHFNKIIIDAFEGKKSLPMPKSLQEEPAGHIPGINLSTFKNALYEGFVHELNSSIIKRDRFYANASEGVKYLQELEVLSDKLRLCTDEKQLTSYIQEYGIIHKNKKFKESLLQYIL
jgi:hypothetical protein